MWENELTPEYLAKHPELDRVLGQHMYPFSADGPNREHTKAMTDTGTDPFA